MDCGLIDFKSGPRQLILTPVKYIQVTGLNCTLLVLYFELESVKKVWVVLKAVILYEFS